MDVSSLPVAKLEYHPLPHGARASTQTRKSPAFDFQKNASTEHNHSSLYEFGICPTISPNLLSSSPSRAYGLPTAGAAGAIGLLLAFLCAKYLSGWKEKARWLLNGPDLLASKYVRIISAVHALLHALTYVAVYGDALHNPDSRKTIYFGFIGESYPRAEPSGRGAPLSCCHGRRGEDLG